ncbi:MAG: DUF3576 domain-containing protein [Proteobacteria bacterium]|nr:DUF3576 domain-containing protein [Pseudomonadota bacterium]
MILAAAAVAIVALSACGVPLGPPMEEDTTNEAGYLFGERGVPLFRSGAADTPAGGGGIGINAFLWRATLDTISFMPLASADPFGGVIITDWYAPPASGGNERFKLSVFILDQRLRADGVKVTVFRQERVGQEWIDARVGEDTATNLEDSILTRARELWLDANAGP